MATSAQLTSPDLVFAITITIQNPEMVYGAYPVQLSAASPLGQQFAVEWNGQRVYEQAAQSGSGQG
jgi:hypothetical protein